MVIQRMMAVVDPLRWRVGGFDPSFAPDLLLSIT